MRKRIMTVNKEDWAFLKMNKHQNKQGKSKDILKETTVLLVKDLTKYITKLAESESAALDVQSGELPVCFDADAGGGRFLAVFTFLNREDGEVKLGAWGWNLALDVGLEVNQSKPSFPECTP